MKNDAKLLLFFSLFNDKFTLLIFKGKTMQKFCHACGMPLVKKGDFAGGDENSNFCCHCVNANGSVKSCEEIFEGGAQYFMNQVDNDRKMAEKITIKNMSQQPYWQGKDCEILKGETATDEEFAVVLKKIGLQ